MAFTGAEKIQIRRFCGYPVFGNSPGTGLGYRFHPYYEALEWKMNHLCAEEERLVREMYLPRLAQLATDLFDQTRAPAGRITRRNIGTEPRCSTTSDAGSAVI